MDDVISLTTLLKSALVHLPAVWIMVGAAVLLIGWLTGLTWLYLGFSFFVVYMGAILKLPGWVGKLSPFGHVPQIPMDDINIGTMAALILTAIGLIFAGFAGYNRRDIEG